MICKQLFLIFCTNICRSKLCHKHFRDHRTLKAIINILIGYMYRRVEIVWSTGRLRAEFTYSNLSIVVSNKSLITVKSRALLKSGPRLKKNIFFFATNEKYHYDHMYIFNKLIQLGFGKKLIIIIWFSNLD